MVTSHLRIGFSKQGLYVGFGPIVSAFANVNMPEAAWISDVVVISLAVVRAEQAVKPINNSFQAMRFIVAILDGMVAGNLSYGANPEA